MSFIESNENGLVYMCSDRIGARHAFTTRFGGVSGGIFATLNLGSNRGDDPGAVRENYRRVCALFGVGIDDAAVTNQVHKNEVRIVTAADRHVCMSKVPYEADGLVTAEKGLPTFTDQVMHSAIHDMCRTIFRKNSVDELNREQKTTLISEVRRRFSADANQIGRVVGIPYSEVIKMLEDF